MSNSSTVTLRRSDCEALVDRVEDADDRVTIAAAAARAKALGVKAARADTLPLDLVKALAGGSDPVRLWRKHRKMLAIRATLLKRDYALKILYNRGRATGGSDDNQTRALRDFIQ